MAVQRIRPASRDPRPSWARRRSSVPGPHPGLAGPAERSGNPARRARIRAHRPDGGSDDPECRARPAHQGPRPIGEKWHLRPVTQRMPAAEGAGTAQQDLRRRISAASITTASAVRPSPGERTPVVVERSSDQQPLGTQHVSTPGTQAVSTRRSGMRPGPAHGPGPSGGRQTAKPSEERRELKTARL